MTSSRTIPVAIIIGGIIVALAVYLSMRAGISPEPQEGDPSLVRPVQATDHILGNPNAPLQIVEYSDFDCEYCKEFHTTLHQLLATEGVDGEVAWIFRQLPVSEAHPNAMSHARASECAAIAGGNEGFWKFADALYANQPADPKSYGSLAQSVGIPSAAFSDCYVDAASTVDPRILADRENAIAAGAQGTPYSLILRKGKTPIVVEGAYPYDILKQQIDELLN